jgi:predicted MPP superfamily phosphohydrolase
VPLWFVARRGKPPGTAQLVAVGVWALVVYGSFIEPRLLVTREYAIDLRHGGPGFGKQLDLAVISDLHLGKYRHAEWLARVVRAVNARHPDAVLIAGDLASAAAAERSFAPLADLESRYGTYAVLGNWDYRVGAVGVRRAVEGHKVEVLTDESVALGTADAPVSVIGLDDLTYGTPDWDKAFAGVPADRPYIVLSHEPDAAPQAELRGADLTIAGHTHGGQIRLPLIGPVPSIPTGIGQGFDRGLFAVGPSQLFITPGVGESWARARLLQRPEISLLHITY